MRAVAAGDPKGVMLTHAAVVATVASLIQYLEKVGRWQAAQRGSAHQVQPLVGPTSRRK
jgi:hypothetical protein